MGIDGGEAVVLLISSLGLISALRSSIKLLNWVWVTFLRPQKSLKSYGAWGLITGPTDGIGRALAIDMAVSGGLNLVLVGRNPSKLEAVENEIRGLRADVRLKSVVLDLAHRTGAEICDAVGKEIEGLDVGVVVNNAGLAYPYARFFHEVDQGLTMDILRVNIEAATWISRAVLPGMLRKKKGAIINIGSASTALFPSYPFYTLYAASKAYLAMFSRSIGVEYKKYGIDIQCQIPVLVATKMSKMRHSSLLVASPETYSKASIRSMGYELLSTPYWSHSIQSFVAKSLPDFLLNRCLYSYFVSVNKRAKLKAAKKIK